MSRDEDQTPTILCGSLTQFAHDMKIFLAQQLKKFEEEKRTQDLKARKKLLGINEVQAKLYRQQKMSELAQKYARDPIAFNIGKELAQLELELQTELNRAITEKTTFFRHSVKACQEKNDKQQYDFTENDDGSDDWDEVEKPKSTSSFTSVGN